MVFGEEVKGFPVRVFNEREVRAAAGILLIGALISFMNAWLVGNYIPLKYFVVIFLIDFIIRLAINPKYAPTMIIGRFFVRNHQPEYTGAPQKMFAWSLGMILAGFMFVWLVIFNFVGPINLFVCMACLIFLTFESIFGICLGCEVYKLIDKKTVMLCPGNVCTPKQRQAIQKINWKQIAVLVLIIGALFTIGAVGLIEEETPQVPDFIAPDDCEVPQWAIDMGHRDQYLIHHGCV